MSEARQREALAALARSEGIEEIFVFSTCNRTEFVAWGDPTLAENSILRFLTAQYDLKLCEWSSFYRLLDERALTHAFGVSAGLDSMLIGEGQIGRQVNAAWQQAKAAGSTGRYLNAMLKKALAVRRRVRRETQFSQESTPHCAVELAAEIFGSLARKKIVLLGAGRMIGAVADALLERGAESITTVRRNAREGDAPARRDVKTVGWKELRASITAADLLISATSDHDFVLSADELRSAMTLEGRKLVILDLALPRDIDPRVREIEGVLLYDLDDLERASKPQRGMESSEAAVQEIVRAEVANFQKQLLADGVEPEVRALQNRLDEICRQELESFRLEQGPFPKDQDQLLSAVSTRITHRIAGSLARTLTARTAH